MLLFFFSKRFESETDYSKANYQILPKKETKAWIGRGDGKEKLSDFSGWICIISGAQEALSDNNYMYDQEGVKSETTKLKTD